MRKTDLLSRAACAVALLAGGNTAAQADDGHHGKKDKDRPAGIVRQLEVLATGPAFGGVTPPGAAGPYRYIAGVVHGELDPHSRLNAGIVNLDKAPRGANGYVAYTANFAILTPQNASDARRIAFYDVVNRGNKLANGTFIGGSGNSLTGAAPAANFPSMLRYGYTVVWSGWQGDIAQSNNPTSVMNDPVGTSFPIASNRDGSSITGLSREEFIPDYAGGSPTQFKLSYPPASLTNTSEVTFTARQSWLTDYGDVPPGDETYTAPSVPVTSWHYVDNGDGSYSVSFTPPASVPGPRGSSVAADAGTIYSFVYRAKDPRVNGIGFAAVRDLMSFLRNESEDASGNANPLNFLKDAECAKGHGCARHPKTNLDVAMIEGISQSGRFTRDLLWQGFNEDSEGRAVFDGAMPIIPGSRKTYTNYEFSQPGRWSKQHEDHFQPGDQFPFAYNVIRDPVSHRVDGVFARCEASNTCPKVMQIDGAYEWWGARASLVVTDGAGHDLKLPKDVRYYLVPGTRHNGGNGVGTGIVTQPAPGDQCQIANTDVAEQTVDRAMVPALERWIVHGTPPPPSQYPTVASGKLVPPTSVAFPNLANVMVPNGAAATPTLLHVNFTGLYNPLYVIDYSHAVPVVDTAKRYKVLVPQVDANGNETSGVPVPEVVVPLASYTGWNLRGQGHAVGEGCVSSGATIPFAVSEGAKAGGSDPRSPLSSLYIGRSDYQAKVTRQVDTLVSEGYLLPLDGDAYKARAMSVSPALIPNP
jgi:hypothetical protein